MIKTLNICSYIRRKKVTWCKLTSSGTEPIELKGTPSGTSGGSESSSERYKIKRGNKVYYVAINENFSGQDNKIWVNCCNTSMEKTGKRFLVDSKLLKPIKKRKR